MPTYISDVFNSKCLRENESENWNWTAVEWRGKEFQNRLCNISPLESGV